MCLSESKRLSTAFTYTQFKMWNKERKEMQRSGACVVVHVLFFHRYILRSVEFLVKNEKTRFKMTENMILSLSSSVTEAKWEDKLT